MTTGAAALQQETPTPTTTTPNENQTTTTDEPIGNQIEDEVRQQLENQTSRSTTTSPTASSTSTPTPPTPQTPDLNENATTYAAEIGPVTKLVDWEYRDGSFYLLIESKVPNRLTLSESPDVSRGAGAFNIKAVNVPKGRTMLEMRAAEHNGAAVVTLTTSQCVAAGSCGYVSSGDKADSTSPFEQTTSTAGWLGGVAVTGAMVSIAAYRRKHKEHDAVEDLA